MDSLETTNEKAKESLPSGNFPLNMWYVAALSKELDKIPIARTLLDNQVVLYRSKDGSVNALEDRCCHRNLPLSMGIIEDNGLRCSYHGLLFDKEGAVIEVPGSDTIPPRAHVRKYHVKEQDSIVWMWFGNEANETPINEPPRYEIHTDENFVFDGDMYRYHAPYQLIHDNLLDLSHLGYVHIHTIGGDANTHMSAKLISEAKDDKVFVKRYMPNSTPPPTYTAAYPFKGKVDRWQELEFCPSHIKIWTGAVDVDTDSLDDPNRKGFHMRGFHGITPETSETCHYFWTMATNPKNNIEEIKEKVIDQTKRTFDEDKIVVEAQYVNMKKFGTQPMIDFHVDIGPNRARRIIKKLSKNS
ncbi:MAG TPA: aromatic ring-hydroxylating dioxygenase subunit alpha [Flavobacterium sp.]|nr:aromatic ring-hydroxylating dioxygenase subunit alpha [Flavobacterium sp.]